MKKKESKLTPIMEFTLNDKSISIDDKINYVNSEITVLENKIDIIDNKMSDLGKEYDDLKDDLRRTIRLKSRLEAKKFRVSLAKRLAKLRHKEIFLISRYILDTDEDKIGLLDEPFKNENKSPQVVILKFTLNGYETKIDEDNKFKVYLKYDSCITYIYNLDNYGLIHYWIDNSIGEDSVELLLDDELLFKCNECLKKYLDIIDKIKENCLK